MASERSGNAGSSIRAFDQRDLDVLFRIDPIKPVGDNSARRPVELGGQFGAGGARADDRNIELPGRSASGWVWALRHALMSRRLNRVACSGVSSAIACCATPGVSKSLLTVPIAMMSVS